MLIPTVEPSSWDSTSVQPTGVLTMFWSNGRLLVRWLIMASIRSPATNPAGALTVIEAVGAAPPAVLEAT